MPPADAAVFVPIPPEALLVPNEVDVGQPAPPAQETEDPTFSADDYRGDGFGPPEVDGPVSSIRASDQQNSDAFNNQDLGEGLYEFHSGLRVQTPMGAASTAGDMVRIHADFWTKVVEWSYERLNAWPDCPHPETGDPNLILVYARIQPAKPLEGPGGHRVYRVSGRYEYRLVKPLLEWGPFPTVASPESTAKPSDNSLPPASFKRGTLAGY